MYRVNEEKTFVDSVDDQLVALSVETGAYFTFNEAATAVFKDLCAGYGVDELDAALRAMSGDDSAQPDVVEFARRLVEKQVLEEVPGETDGQRPEMAVAALSAAGVGISLDVDEYDDVAAYFMVDPIHEVDPDMGWPYVQPQ